MPVKEEGVNRVLVGLAGWRIQGKQTGISAQDQLTATYSDLFCSALITRFRKRISMIEASWVALAVAIIAMLTNLAGIWVSKRMDRENANPTINQPNALSNPMAASYKAIIFLCLIASIGGLTRSLYTKSSGFIITFSVLSLIQLWLIKLTPTIPARSLSDEENIVIQLIAEWMGRTNDFARIEALAVALKYHPTKMMAILINLENDGLLYRLNDGSGIMPTHCQLTDKGLLYAASTNKLHKLS